MKLLEWFANGAAALVVMEACGGAHEWGRALMGLGHEVRLISPRKVRPFVQRNKTDAADAQAIWTAGQQPSMRPSGRFNGSRRGDADLAGVERLTNACLRNGVRCASQNERLASCDGSPCYEVSMMGFGRMGCLL